MMIREMLAEHTWLWPLIWQSTAVLALGLVGSLAARKHASRAHQLLLLALVAAIVAPAMSALVRQRQWGLLEARPAPTADTGSFVTLAGPQIAESTPQTNVSDPAASGSAVSLSSAEPGDWTGEWKRLVLPVWIVLSAALLSRLGIRFSLGHRLATRSEEWHAADITDTVGSAKIKLGIRTGVHIRRSARTPSPVIWCWGSRPVLLLPKNTNIDEAIDWPSIICHELAHWKRRDHLSGLWAELMVCALPWNSLVWIAHRRLLSLAEEACDDWVIASGQLGTRYARTLLGLTPQGRAALVPAVVSSRKGLATRVRRILADRCGNPRSGLRWTLAVTAVASSLAVGVALAQTRPADSTEMVTTSLGHRATIAQPKSVETLKIRVLDSDGSPAGNVKVIALPMTIYGGENGPYFKEGCCELLWSPTWLEPDQHLCLIAQGPGQQKQATFVEVTDPEKPLAIQLEPAFSIEAKVVDSDGQRIPRYTAVLWLPRDFKCQAPIHITGVGVPRTEIFSVVPHGPTYELVIEVDGYQTKHVMVDGTDGGKDVVDLGDVILKHKTPEHPGPAPRASNDELKRAFLELYKLDPGEAVRLIKTPYVLGRREWLLTEGRECGLGFDDFKLGWDWTGRLEQPGYGFTGQTDLSAILRLMLRMPRHDFNIPKRLNVRLPEGDWIVRAGLPMEEKVEALQEIILAETGRAIKLEKRRVDREVVVIRGRYKLTSHPDGRQPNHVRLSWDGEVGDRHEEANSLADIFERLERETAMKFVDESEPRPKTAIPFVATNNLAWIRDFPEVKREHLGDLLYNLAKTTSLKLTVEKWPAEMWFVVEGAPKTSLGAEE